MPVVLGVDSSTQSTKVEVRDADTGALLASARAPHPPATPPRSEQPPAAWWAALARACFEAGVDRVDAVAVAGQQHGLVVTDRSGAPLRPAKLWNDTESAPEAAELVEAIGAATWAAACGSVPVASFTVTKLAWLARHEPATLRAAAQVLLPHDWLTWRLAGRPVTDRGDASGTGYWSPAAETYRPDLLAAALEQVAAEVDPAPERLPPVLGPDEPAGSLTRWAGDQLGLRAPYRTVVGPGTGDNMAGALGIALGPGDVAISLGTSGTVYAVSGTPSCDPTGAVAGFADATGRFLPLVCTLNATRVTDTVAGILGADLHRLDLLAADAPIGAGGLTLLPYLDGERTPDRPGATGLLAGIRTGTTPEQLARAAFEGVVCGLLDGLEAIGAAGIPTDGRLLLVGGGARSDAYRRVLADLSQRPVVVPAEDEAVALGACVQAAAVLHARPPLEVADAWEIGRSQVEVVDPDTSPAAADAATAARAAYRRLRDATA